MCEITEGVARARAQLLRLIKTRPRSKYEARTRLRQKGFSNTVIEQVIEMAEANGLLDDEAFAKLWIEERALLKPKGQQALEQELREKGIDREIISKLLKESSLDEYAAARQLIEERLSRYRFENPQDRERKLSAFLRRRGFSFQLINKILKELLA
ncbi:regulatory protein RecX [Candidatus Acetothermia bacterium]|nr:regulatory protein RecX [Candidatus Acetothermia bacterium]